MQCLVFKTGTKNLRICSSCIKNRKGDIKLSTDLYPHVMNKNLALFDNIGSLKMLDDSKIVNLKNVLINLFLCHENLERCKGSNSRNIIL